MATRTDLKHVHFIASDSTWAQHHSSGLRVTADTNVSAQMPIDLRTASCGSGIEVSTTPAFSGGTGLRAGVPET